MVSGHRLGTGDPLLSCDIDGEACVELILTLDAEPAAFRRILMSSSADKLLDEMNGAGGSLGIVRGASSTSPPSIGDNGDADSLTGEETGLRDADSSGGAKGSIASVRIPSKLKPSIKAESNPSFSIVSCFLATPFGSGYGLIRFRLEVDDPFARPMEETWPTANEVSHSDMIPVLGCEGGELRPVGGDTDGEMDDATCKDGELPCTPFNARPRLGLSCAAAASRLSDAVEPSIARLKCGGGDRDFADDASLGGEKRNRELEVRGRRSLRSRT